LCYYSQLENKRLVLLDSHQLYGAEITKLDVSARRNAFQLKTSHIETPGDEPQIFVFACSSAEEATSWRQFLKACSRMDVVPTMNLGAGFAQKIGEYNLTIKNRRVRVKEGEEHKGFESVFKGDLWKVKAAGSRMQKVDWFKRHMWLSRNGSLVYWSPKEDRELVYYTATDLCRATLVKIPNNKSLKAWTFQIQLPHNGDIVFAPADFAAETESMRDTWIQEFAKAAQVAH